MANARELLEQVDALMRRNREEAANAEIPVLTDVVSIGQSLRPAQTAPAANEEVDVKAPETVPAPSAGAPPATTPSDIDPQRWERIAEDVRMQVLQRIDIFTDTGLQEQLKARLQPIVDRASADLVNTISQHIGELLRTYVAEAIEREIDKWKKAAD